MTTLTETEPTTTEAAETEPTTKTCGNCGLPLDIVYFLTSNGAVSNYCNLCRSDYRESRPWTDDQIALLIAAARNALDLWPRYVDIWNESDLAAWRDLLAATGRDPVTEDMRDRTQALVDAFFEVRTTWPGPAYRVKTES